LTVCAVKSRQLTESLLLDLDAGEAEAIALAVEMKAGLLLLDERRGRNVAQRFGLKFVGLMGMLIEAKWKGHVPAVKPILDDLTATAGFWVDNGLYARVVQEAGE
jgi:predicted nucleic acid-binding protein